MSRSENISYTYKHKMSKKELQPRTRLQSGGNWSDAAYLLSEEPDDLSSWWMLSLIKLFKHDGMIGRLHVLPGRHGADVA